VFDRLNRLGLSISYGHSLRILDSFGGYYIDYLRAAVRNGLAFRIVGDNINWMSTVHDERADHHGKLVNGFCSVAILQTVFFEDMSSQSAGPAVPEDYLLASADLVLLRRLIIHLVLDVLRTHLPCFAFLPDDTFSQEHGSKLNVKSTVIPLPILLDDEMKYEDVLHTMDWYEELLANVYGEHIPATHIGGDQLTRERLSGSKRLRASAKTPARRFDHLTPITFEFFHLQMNVLKYAFKDLFCKSCTSTGTLFATAIRINRKNFNGDVTSHFDTHKDFTVSFIDAHIVEAAMEFFAIDTTMSSPTRHWQHGMNEEEKRLWATSVVGQFVDEYVLDEVRWKMGLSSSPNDPSRKYTHMHICPMQRLALVDTVLRLCLASGEEGGGA
jgi:hypothetical protein